LNACLMCSIQCLPADSRCAGLLLTGQLGNVKNDWKNLTGSFETETGL